MHVPAGATSATRTNLMNTVGADGSRFTDADEVRGVQVHGGVGCAVPKQCVACADVSAGISGANLLAACDAVRLRINEFG